jgi:tight adherence protein C
MSFTLQLLLEFVTFGVVVFVTFAIVNSVQNAAALRRRLGDANLANAGDIVGYETNLIKEQTVRNPILRWVQVTTSNDPKEAQQLARQLAFAGFESPSAPVWFVIARFSFAIGLPLLYLLSQRLSGASTAGAGPIFWSLVLCGGGFMAPSIYVDRRAEARKTQLEREFPDSLDLIVVCMEAGLGLEAAFVRVGHEMRESHPRISQEFGRVSEELAAGRSRSDALRNMSDRAGVDAVKSFAALLIQTEALGISIGQTMRTYSNEMRETRMLKAEEKAMRIPVLMTIPLIACILPVIVTTILLPPIIDVIRVLLPALNGR